MKVSPEITSDQVMANMALNPGKKVYLETPEGKTVEIRYIFLAENSLIISAYIDSEREA